MGKNRLEAFSDGVIAIVITQALISRHGKDSALAIALGKDWKGKISIVFYVLAILLSFINSWFSCSLYVLVAILWLIPDRRIENTLSS
jgi:uncharacterized membrane protein